jgi:hypothetical protein
MTFAHPSAIAVSFANINLPIPFAIYHLIFDSRLNKESVLFLLSRRGL